MSSALSWGLNDLQVVRTHEPVARCQADDSSVATAVVTPGALRLLVAADVDRYSLMVAHTFRRAAAQGASLGVIADILDDAVARVSLPAVCATLVDVTPEGYTVLHRGGPSPVVVRADGALTRVVPAVPGAPLGPHLSTSTRPGELVPASEKDVLLVTTPGSVEPAIRAMAGATEPTMSQLWQALREMGPTAAGSAYALVGRGE